MRWSIRDWLWAAALFAIACSNAATAHRLRRAESLIATVDSYRCFREDLLESRIKKIELQLECTRMQGNDHATQIQQLQGHVNYLMRRDLARQRADACSAAEDAAPRKRPF